MKRRGKVDGGERVQGGGLRKLGEQKKNGQVERRQGMGREGSGWESEAGMMIIMIITFSPARGYFPYEASFFQKIQSIYTPE